MAEIRPLTKDQQEFAIAKLGEVPERIPEDLQNLKTWILQQPHLRARMDDQFLIQFLRGSKYSLEKAKRKLENFYSLKTRWPDLFSVTDVDEVKFRQFNNTGCFGILPIPLNENGPRIVVWRFNFSPQEFEPSDVMRQCVAMCEVTIMSDSHACIYGTVFIMDFSKATANNLLMFNPNILKNTATFLLKSIPVAVKAVYLLNLNPYAEKFSRLSMNILPEKIKRRVFICGPDGVESLPKKYLPVEFGGENGSLDSLCIEYNQVWNEHRQYFKENAKYYCLEHLRLGKTVDHMSQFEMELEGGSFRKIMVD